MSVVLNAILEHGTSHLIACNVLLTHGTNDKMKAANESRCKDRPSYLNRCGGFSFVPIVVDIWGAGCAELLRLVLLTHSDL